VFVVSDYGNELSETDERNNVGVDTQAMVITVAPPADLVVESVSAPASGSPGTPMPIQWVVRNAGSIAAVGQWYDSVYLSADNRWDNNDTLIGRFERSGSLEPGASYTGQLNEPLPGVVPGNYYIIVRTDARNTVRETDESNNAGVAGPVALDVIELQLGVPFINTLSVNARNHFYKVNVPAGQTLLWSVDSQLENVETELFVRYNQIALRSAYDYRNERPFGADQEAVVPRSQAGYYYGLVYGADVPQNSPYQTVVQALPFGIRAVSPNIVGNAGFASLRIQGAQLTDASQVFLVLAGGERRLAIDVTNVSASEVRALLNMQQVPPGQYTIGVRLRSGEEAILENAINVVDEPNSHPPLVVRILGPESARAGSLVSYYVTIYNGGRNDAIAALVYLRLPEGAEYFIPGMAPPPSEAVEQGIPPHYEPGDGWRYIPLIVPVIPAQGAATFRVRVRAVDADLVVKAIVVGSVTPGEYRPDGSYFLPTGCVFSVMRAILDCLSAAGLSIGGCAYAFMKWIYSYLLSLWTVASPNAGGWEIFNVFWQLFAKAIKTLAHCLRTSIPVLNWLNCGVSVVNAARSCSGGNSSYESYEIQTEVVRPLDPNEKQSPTGFGEQRFVSRREAIPYTVLFENMPTAQAHAREVVITDQLDPDLDWRTFEVGTGFGA
jgi:hypothetical protein